MTATHTTDPNTTSGSVLYVAFELGWNSWKIASTIGAVQKPRIRTIPGRDINAVIKEIADANRLILDFPDAGIQVLNGRYGPYITDKERNAKIPKGKEPKSLTLQECQALLAAAPVRKWGRKAAKPAKIAKSPKSAKGAAKGKAGAGADAAEASGAAAASMKSAAKGKKAPVNKQEAVTARAAPKAKAKTRAKPKAKKSSAKKKT